MNISLIFLGLIAFDFRSTAQISFAEAIQYPTNDVVEAIEIKDLNMDGLQDIIIGLTDRQGTNGDHHGLAIFYQEDDGSLAEPIMLFTEATTHGIHSIETADLNQDGHLDIILSFGSKVGVALQQKNEIFNEILEVYGGNGSSGNSITALSVADINGDGFLDFAASFSNAPHITLFYNLPSDSLNILSCDINADMRTGINHLELRDINNDGITDVTWGSGRSTSEPGFHYFLQDEDGIFNDRMQLIDSERQSYRSYAMGDVNNDGFNDLVTSVSANQPFGEIIIWLYDPIIETFSSPGTHLEAYDVINDTDIVDLNCDGKNEIIAVHGTHSSLTTYEQNESGQYSTYINHFFSYFQSMNTDQMEFGDFNNDGALDVVIAGFYTGFYVILNTTPQEASCIEEQQQPVVETSIPQERIVEEFVTSTMQEGMLSSDTSFYTLERNEETATEIIYYIDSFKIIKTLDLSSTDIDSHTVYTTLICDEVITDTIISRTTSETNNLIRCDSIFHGTVETTTSKFAFKSIELQRCNDIGVSFNNSTYTSSGQHLDTVFNESGIDTIYEITVYDDINVYLPNIVDRTSQANSCFKPHFSENPSNVILDLKVYDRYGNLVYIQKDKDQCWDGTHNNQQQVATGVYVWTLKAALDACTLVRTGSITVLD